MLFNLRIHWDGVHLEGLGFVFPTLAGVPALIPTEADLVHMALGHGHVKHEPGRIPPRIPLQDTHAAIVDTQYCEL